MIRKFLAMGAWRILGVLAGAIGGIWAARELGPEKLGISGMVVAYGTQAALFVGMGINALLIREFKQTASDPVAQARLISESLSYRLFVAVILSALWVMVALLLPLPSEWWLATSMGVLALIAGACATDWLLQAQENQVAQQRLVASGGFLSAALLIAFVRDSSPAGSDLVVAALVSVYVLFVTWRASISGRHGIALGLGCAMANLPRLWKGRWMFVTGLLIYVYVRLELPLIGWLRSVDEVGQYRSAQQVLQGIQPIFALVPAILYPRMIEWAKEGGMFLWAKQIRIFALLFVVSGIVALVAWLAIPIAYPAVFGERFSDAAIPCVLLVVSKCLVLLNGVFAWGLWSIERDLTLLCILGVVALVSLGLNLLLIPKYGMMAAASVNVFSEGLILVGCALFQYRHCSTQRLGV